MATPTALTLPQEIFLLALKDVEGTLASGVWWTYGVGGAILAELQLAGRIAIVDKKVQVVSAAPLGDPLLDEALSKIATAKRRAAPSGWASRFAGMKELKLRLAEPLIRRGILRVDEDKVLWIFTRKIFPEVDSKPEKALIARLEKAITSDTANVDARTVTAVAIAHAIGALKVVFPKKLLKERKTRLKAIVEGDASSQATQHAITAVVTTIALMTVISATSVTS